MNAHSCNLQYFSDQAAARWFVRLRNASRKLGIKAATEITTGTYQAAQPPLPDNPSQYPHNFPLPNIFFFFSANQPPSLRSINIPASSFTSLQ